MEVQCRIHKGSTIILILSWLNPIPRIDTHLFKVHSNLRLGFPKGLFPVDLPVNILEILLPFSILAIWPAHLHLLHLISLAFTVFASIYA